MLLFFVGDEAEGIAGPCDGVGGKFGLFAGTRGPSASARDAGDRRMIDIGVLGRSNGDARACFIAAALDYLLSLCGGITHRIRPARAIAERPGKPRERARVRLAIRLFLSLRHFRCAGGAGE